MAHGSQGAVDVRRRRRREADSASGFRSKSRYFAFSLFFVSFLSFFSSFFPSVFFSFELSINYKQVSCAIRKCECAGNAMKESDISHPKSQSKKIYESLQRNYVVPTEIYANPKKSRISFSPAFFRSSNFAGSGSNCQNEFRGWKGGKGLGEKFPFF